MENYKSIFKSVTFWSIVVGFIAKLAIAFHVLEGSGLDEQAQADLANWLALYVPLLIGFVTDGAAMYGRFRAKTQLVSKQSVADKLNENLSTVTTTNTVDSNSEAQG